MLRALVLSLVFSSAAAAAPVDDAVAFLVGADVFEDSAVGYDGHESDGARAFAVVFAADDAAARFNDVAARGSVVGRLYAAIGLYDKDRAGFDVAVADLRRLGDVRVNAQFGCFEMMPTVASLLDDARKGDIVDGGFTARFTR